MLKTSNRLTIAGTVFLAVAMDVRRLRRYGRRLQHRRHAAVTAMTVGFAWFWYGLPLFRHVQDD